MKTVTILIVLLFIVSVGAFFAYQAFFAHPIHISQVVVSPSPPTISPSPAPPGSLAAGINQALDGTTGSYGIVVKNLKTSESFMSNEHRSFQAGSLYKLWVMAAAFEKIQSGNLSEDDTLSRDIPFLNDEFAISSDSAELDSGTVTMSVSDALNQTITVSGNYSALLLADNLKLSGIDDFLREQSLSDSRVGVNGNPPVTSAYDIFRFFEQLYTGRLANPRYTAAMMDLLKDQQLNTKLPRLLPDNVVMAHKTGEIDNFTHDAGIVFTPQGDYIIVVLSESDAPALAEGRISDISQAVYRYFTKLTP